MGKDNYIIALTADHGFPEVVEYKQEKGQYAHRLKKNEIEKFFKAIVKAEKNYPDLSDKNNNAIKKAAMKFNFIADIYSYSELSGKTKSTDKYLPLYKNSFRKDRVPTITFIFS